MKYNNDYIFDPPFSTVVLSPHDKGEEKELSLLSFVMEKRWNEIYKIRDEKIRNGEDTVIVSVPAKLIARDRNENREIILEVELDFRFDKDKVSLTSDGFVGFEIWHDRYYISVV